MGQVLWVVPNVAATSAEAAHVFYGGVLGMAVVVDHGWIVTLAGGGATAPQISVATQGGTGTPMPDISIEVDDLDAVLDRLNEAGWPLVHGRATEP